MSECITSSIEGQQLIVLANREPYRHERNDEGRLVATRSSSGVVNAVEPLLLERSGVWIAEGVGDADRDAANDHGGVDVPTEGARYRLRRVFLEARERQGYYNGFANGALWPLCHRTAVEPVFVADDFRAYDRVNRRFADVVADEALGPSPIVLVQDYHFALVPRLVRRRLPLGRIATFWHIPWPRPETFSVCPWARALLDGLLGSTAIGFQTAADAQHFLSSAERLLYALIDREAGTVTYEDRTISVGVFPASIAWSEGRTDAASAAATRVALLQEIGAPEAEFLGVSVDRLDYTKGLEHKFLAIERLFEQTPELMGRLVFAELAQPCRDGIPAYRATRQRVRSLASRINRRYPEGGGPIRLIEGNHAPATVERFFKAADLCYVGSLHDGMNLVSKEFVRARDDERGVLMLSAMTGAAQELRDALIVNPYDLEAVAGAFRAACALSPAEQQLRMRRMRQHVARNNARQWAESLIASVMSRGVQRESSWSLDRLSAALPAVVTPPALAASDISVS
jgi:trehalose 6-phosphate synthase